MKYINLIFILILFSCNGQTKNKELQKNKEQPKSVKTSNQNQHTKELSYIKRRNKNIKFFKNKEFSDRVDRQMNDSLQALEKLLKDILTDTKIENISKTGHINLETFFDELGFGKLDALGTYNKKVSKLCTTKFLFSDYFKKERYDLQDFNESDLENILTAAFASSYVITGVYTFEIKSDPNIKAYGMISIDGQDIGPFNPNNLYLVASTKEHIYLVSKGMEKEFKQIEKCSEIWKNVDSENKAWKAYCECYKREIPNHEQLLSIKEEIQEIYTKLFQKK
ncbi:hypothetical protein [Tenacibaculum jejuense]|uniref:Lipoprotein n=1 Tax=Tenacibaculum jejuense TaxID=584609 RepID=A0A238U6E3_9FLAO|nr:hypothetical protein [Tenacibaculum jejuense]SNR14158.1 conserved protein of unknown function [Tenacibaculum jejuense]